MRIVSLLPSATEIVWLLGLQDALVAVSDECDFPPPVRRLPKVVRSRIDPATLSQGQIDEKVRAGISEKEISYEIDERLLASLSPDLVIAQELCDVCAIPLASVIGTLEELAPRARRLSLHPHSLDDVFGDIRRVGDATGTTDRATNEVASRSGRLRRMEKVLRATRRPRVAALEWFDPVMVSGHWVVEMVERAGGRDSLGKDRRPSTSVRWEELIAHAPEVLVLMACGFDAERSARDAALVASRPGWDSIPAVRAGEVYAVNGGAYFNRSGPRLVDGVEILAEILHPEIFARRDRSEDYRSVKPLRP